MKVNARRSRRSTRTSTTGGSITSTVTAKGTKSVTNRAPSSSTAESVTPGSFSVDTSDSGPGSSNGLFVALIALYMIALWNQVFGPIWNTIWTGTKPDIKVGGWIAVGGLVFIFLITGIARISKQWEQAMWVITIGMWMVYLMFNGSQQLQSTVEKTTSVSNKQKTTQGKK